MAFDREARPARPNRGKRRKVCQFCADKCEYIDYKDAAKLRRFVSERSKILPRRTTGTCAMHQRQLTEAIKRARQVALLPLRHRLIRIFLQTESGACAVQAPAFLCPGAFHAARSRSDWIFPTISATMGKTGAHPGAGNEVLEDDGYSCGRGRSGGAHRGPIRRPGR